MKWVIQSSGINDSQARDLMDICSKNNIPYIDVGLIPFTDTIINFEKLNKADEHIFYGSTKLVELIRNTDFRNGVFFNSSFNVVDWIKNRNDMLNEFSIMTLKEFLGLGKTLFVRPVEDLKTFSGEVVGENKHRWYDEKSHGGYSFDLNLEVAVSSVKNVEKEWRIFIVNGEVTTGSQYKVDGRLKVQAISSDILDVATEMAREWLPHETVAMDICYSENNYKIVEFNCFNCAGFYDSDLEKIIKAF